MKKKELKSLKLNKKSISNLSTQIIGGREASIVVHCPIGVSDDTLDRDCITFGC